MRRYVIVFLSIAFVLALSYYAFRHRDSEPTHQSSVPPCMSDCTATTHEIVKTKKGGVIFEVPKKYIKHFDQSDWRPEPNQWEMTLNTRWPDMSAFTMAEIDALFKEWDKTGRDKAHGHFLSDLIEIKFKDHGSIPTPITAQDLEAAVVKQFGLPRSISGLPTLQEYPENPRNNAYRTTNDKDRLADGMPVYIFCAGKPLSKHPDEITGGCRIQMTWPNGFEVDINFNRTYLSKWRDVHDQSIMLLRSFMTGGNFPAGSLLKDTN